MAAGKQAAKDYTIEYDDAPGGALQDISQYVNGDVVLKIIVALEETDGFGEEWPAETPTGHASYDPVTIPMWYDDTAATGPAIVFAIQSGDRDPQGATRTLQLTYGNSKSTTVETRLASVERGGKRRGLSLLTAEVHPIGEPTEA